MVRHCVGINLAKCKSFSSSSRDHSVFLMLGSNHSNQRALHCFADFLCSKDAIRDHWFLPYFITAALRISSWTMTKINYGQTREITEFTNLSVSPNTSLNHYSRHSDRRLLSILTGKFSKQSLNFTTQND